MYCGNKFQSCIEFGWKAKVFYFLNFSTRNTGSKVIKLEEWKLEVFIHFLVFINKLNTFRFMPVRGVNLREKNYYPSFKFKRHI